MREIPCAKTTIRLFACAVWLLPVACSTTWAASIGGTILTNGIPVTKAVQVNLLKQSPQTLIYELIAFTNSNATDGTYSFSGLSDGFYNIQVVDHTGYYAAEIYDNVYRQSEATAIEVSKSAATISPVDITLEMGASISGRVVDTFGSGIEGIAVGIEEMVASNSTQLAGSFVGVGTDASGYFKVGLRPGIYTVAFMDYSVNPKWASQLFSNTVSHDWATQLVLTNVGQAATNVSAVMQQGYSISGFIKYPNGKPASEVFASFFVFDSSTGQWGTTVSKLTEGDGFYSVNFPPGIYGVLFEEDSMLYEQEYWDNSPNITNASVIVVSNANVANINTVLDYSPLANWALGYGLDPFANVAGWLKEDPDTDNYSNLHEFAFGTDPTNSASGYPYQIGQPTNGQVLISALINTNVSTAYWLDYAVQQRTNLITGTWTNSPYVPQVIPSSPTLNYIRMGLILPTSPDPHLFMRTQATIGPF